MLKKLRRSIHNSGVAIKNFIVGTPNTTKNFVKEIPSAAKRFMNWLLSFRGFITIIALIGLILFPVITRDDYYITILVTAMIYAIFAASWDFLAGYVGQVSFGHSSFFGVSGYATAIFMKFYGFSWLAAILMGAAVSMLFALAIGIPCLRLKGPYLALATLAFSLILFNLFLMPDFPYGGTDGISGLPAIYPDALTIFFVILGFMLITMLALHAIVSSRAGTVFKAIRDDEVCAEASGINTTKYKLIAFMISGFFAGIAGAIFAVYFRAVSPALYQPLYSFYAIIMAAIGGLTTISGAVVGSFFFVILSEVLTRYTPLGSMAGGPLLIFSIILIIVVLLADMGIMNPIIDNLKKLYENLKTR